MEMNDEAKSKMENSNPIPPMTFGVTEPHATNVNAVHCHVQTMSSNIPEPPVSSKSTEQTSGAIAAEYPSLLPPSPRRLYRDANINYDEATTESAFSTGKVQELINTNKPAPLGDWVCCKCHTHQAVYGYHHGPHLASTLQCACAHRSCEKCNLTGNLKVYKPVEEPDLVPVSDDKHRTVRFGLFCGACGLSWRAQVIKHPFRNMISALPAQLTRHATLAQPLSRTGRSRSMMNLLPEPSVRRVYAKRSYANLRAISNEMVKVHGEQAKTALVRFSGIQCTCGEILNSSALCFQVVEPASVPQEQQEEPKEKKPSFTATPEDRVRGIGRSMITLSKNGRSIMHHNPLMSNPVTGSELRRLMGDSDEEAEGVPKSSGL